MQRIFISIASYMDPHLERTIRSALEAAAEPQRVLFGVVEQAQRAQRGELRALCDRIAYVHIDPRDSLGACWARALAQSLYDGEDYYCQIDAHTMFEQGWDRIAIDAAQELAARTGNPRILLSNLPTPFEFGPRGEVVLLPHGPPFRLVPNMTTFDPLRGPIPGNKAQRIDADGPVASATTAAGFVFAPATLIAEAPYDPLLYFNGEELALSIKAFTWGWDVWQLNPAPLRHLYKTARRGESFRHWDGSFEGSRRWLSGDLAERARRRLDDLINGRLTGAYGLGPARPVSAYWKAAGLQPVRRDAAS